MTHPLRRLIIAGLFAAAFVAAPVAAADVAVPVTTNPGCPPGETGVTNGCSPFCLPGLVLSTETGLCIEAPEPPPPPSQPMRRT